MFLNKLLKFFIKQHRIFLYLDDWVTLHWCRYIDAKTHLRTRHLKKQILTFHLKFFKQLKSLKCLFVFNIIPNIKILYWQCTRNLDGASLKRMRASFNAGMGRVFVFSVRFRIVKVWHHLNDSIYTTSYIQNVVSY